jgi:tetratricopeptide (TPR) repeat protein
LSQYTRARDCAEKLTQLNQVAAVDHAIGTIHEARGEFPQAIDAYMSTLHATADPARRGVIKAEIGAAYVNRADERGLAYLHQSLNELDPATQTLEAGAATLWLGRYYHLRAQYTQALTYLERARSLIEPLDDASMLRLFYGSMAIVLMYSARFEESMAWARRGIALGEAKDDDRGVAGPTRIDATLRPWMHRKPAIAECGLFCFLRTVLLGPAKKRTAHYRRPLPGSDRTYVFLIPFLLYTSRVGDLQCRFAAPLFVVISKR